MRREWIVLSGAVLAASVATAGVDAEGKGQTCKHGFSPTVTDWLVNAAFGYGNNTGNTVNSNLNGSLNLTYSPGRWEHILNLTAQTASENHTRTAEKYTEGFQSRYHYAPKENYVYGLVSGTQNPFGTYDRVIVGSVGHGWTFIDNCHFYFIWQLGPGYRYHRVSGSEEGVSRPVAFTETQFSWYITPKTTFTQKVALEYSTVNTYVQSITSLNTALVKQFGLKLSYEADYNSDIPEGSSNTKKLDTTSLVAITYTFES